MATFLPTPRFFWRDPDTDTPLVGGKVYTYEAGTTTPKLTWADVNKAAELPNPIILEADGGKDVFLDGAYKILVERADGTLVHEIDGVSGGPAGGGGGGTVEEVVYTTDATIVAGDRGKYIVANRPTPIFFSFDPAATLGSWMVTIKNIGQGTLTLNPSGAETIDGKTTKLMLPGTSVILVCNGVSFRTFLPSPYNLGDMVTPDMFGATGDGVADDTGALNAAYAAGKPIYLPPGKRYLVTDYFANPLGVEVFGPGAILTAVTGGEWQRNTYADKPASKYLYGAEYAHRARQYIENGQNSPAGTLVAKFFGDSTVQGGYGEYEKPNAVFNRVMTDKGLPNVFSTNLGAAGTQWSDAAAVILPQLGPTVGIIFIKYMINDAAIGLAAALAQADAALTAIRGHANGGFGSLTIVVVGPNSTDDSPNGRDEEWYEQVQRGYLQLMRKHKFVYWDAYAFSQDSRTAPGLWLDQPYPLNLGIGIHPINYFNARIWGTLFDQLWPRGDIGRVATNSFQNNGSVLGFATLAALPSDYGFGLYWQRAQSSDGWPLDGMVCTSKGMDQIVTQTVHGYAAGKSVEIVRKGINGAWGPWTGVPTAISFSNGWVNFGGAYAPCTVSLSPSGRAYLDGAMASGTVTPGTVWGTLPVNYRPASSQQMIVSGNGSPVGILVQASGSMSFQTAGNATLTSITGASFRVA